MASVERAEDFGIRLRRLRLALAAAQRSLRDVELGQILLCALMGVVVGAVVDLLR